MNTDEDKYKFKSEFVGESITKTKAYQESTRKVLFHIRVKDMPDWNYNKEKIKDLGITIYPSEKVEQYGAKLFQQWIRLIFETYLPQAEKLKVRHPEIFITERLEQNKANNQEIFGKHDDEIKLINDSKKKLIKKIDKEVQIAMKSI
jgi:hypothetical protein